MTFVGGEKKFRKNTICPFCRASSSSYIIEVQNAILHEERRFQIATPRERGVSYGNK